MRNHILSRSQKTRLRTASRIEIISTLSNLNSFRRRDLWIGLSNRYRERTIPRLYTHNQNSSDQNKDLSQYIAVSSILHCFDAWIFLGRAIGALSNGDSHTAHHLAYYAELRASMSLLAGEGIGVFGTKHYVLNNSHLCEKVPDHRNRHNQSNSGTHIFSWLALEHWAGLRRSNNILQSVITPSGIPLYNWLYNFRSGVNSSLIGNDLLTSWGFDLKTISGDREGRNEVSYRPNYLLNQTLIDVDETSSFIQHLWQLFQPFGGSRFESLDRQLLRLCLRKIYTAITGFLPEDNPSDFQTRLKEMIINVNPQSLPLNVWLSFLTDPQTSPVLEEAAVQDNVTFSNRHHLSVISRATLLLRIATGSIASILSAASINKDDIAFWWESYGNQIGLFTQLNPINAIEDLWIDIENALFTMNNWHQNNNQHVNYLQWGQDLAKELKLLEQCERVSFWGMGL